MDRSFLSHAGVVEASRKFVCVRLQTYEDKDEKNLLKSIFRGRSGDLENTTFTIMDPSGTRDLVAPGRSPKMTFSDADAMERRMRSIAGRYTPKQISGQPELPYLEDLRLGLNVAACDNIPLVVTLTDSEANRNAAEKTLRPLAWNEQLRGRFLFASAKSSELEQKAKGLMASSSIVILDPETFGRSGEILSQHPADISAEKLRAELHRAAKLHAPDVKDRYAHVREGGRKGIRWDPELEVTDPGRVGARRTGGRRPGGRPVGGRSTGGRSAGGRRTGGRPGRTDRPSNDDRGSTRDSSRPAHPLLRVLDTDGDGELSAEEIAAASKTIRELDKNGDGKITRDEIRVRSREE